ncbi:c-type cytochrome [Solimicrobium silvestre]|uniref:Cytochrome c2 n=1 Tax=Solimicrobium silvestre TaxID=2099400 RepID=A0A2S9GSX1_9BURK|nr:c-type cytochrome [Solimicrobium silvestre]PRC90810.1 Cytochrome c2 [Solimicrobium silvestre]
MAPYQYLSGMALFFWGVASTVCAAGNAERGLALYQSKCVACHSIDYNGVGPAHKGLFNRKAGSQTDYVYSPAVKGSTIIWNEQTLDKWLSNPEKLIPGQKMGFSVPSAKERADLITYLKITTEQK